jgi:flagellar biosynthetic protein FliP
MTEYLTAGAVTAGEAPARSGARAFASHLGEMLAAMVAGMVVLGGITEGALALAGLSLMETSVSLAAAAMATYMTVPMVWWMRRRGHSPRMGAEMAGSMVVPSIAVIALYELGAIASGTVMAAQHLVMVPAMVAVMLARYEHYSQPHAQVAS